MNGSLTLAALVTGSILGLAFGYATRGDRFDFVYWFTDSAGPIGALMWILLGAIAGLGVTYIGLQLSRG